MLLLLKRRRRGSDEPGEQTSPCKAEYGVRSQQSECAEVCMVILSQPGVLSGDLKKVTHERSNVTALCSGASQRLLIHC